MSFEKRDCSIEMTLEDFRDYGQKGILKIEGQELSFASMRRTGQFFGQLIHVMNDLLCLPKVKKNNSARLKIDYSVPYTKAEGEVLWDFYYHHRNTVRWRLSRLLSIGPLYEDFICTFKVESKEAHHTFEVSFRELCYAVAKCGTEALKQFGIVGYTKHTCFFEDFNVREFLEIKAFALGLESEMSLRSMRLPRKKATSFEKEIELLLFDM